MPNTFRKTEKLCSQKTIAQVFSSGQVVVKYPFRAVFTVAESNGFPPCKIMMTVTKKRFKRANKRNLLRRRMREAYRLQKNPLYQKLNELNIQLSLALIYLPSEELEYTAIHKGMGKLMDKLLLQLTNRNDE